MHSFVVFFLGWKLSDHKLVLFSSVCEMLLLQLDLKDAKLGLTLVSSTFERVAELTSDIEAILKDGQLSRKDQV